MKTLLVFVLSCETSPYDTHLDASIKTWDSRIVDGVDTVFYCGKSKKNSNDKIIYLNTEDTFANMGRKAIEGFEWAFNNKKFDYLARPNSSCYVRKHILKDYIQTLQENNLYLGLKTASCYNVDYMWGGGAYILSRDLVKIIIDNKHLWNHTYTEDVAIADLLTKMGVPLNGKGNACSIHPNGKGGYSCVCYENGGGHGFDFSDYSTIHEKLKNQFFIRVKQDLKRHLDIEIMNDLFKANI